MGKKKNHEEEQRVSLLTEESALVSSTISPSQKQETEMTPMEKLIDKVGGQGTYQTCSFLIFGMIWFFTAWILVGQVFFFDNSFTCFDEEDPDKCQKFICSL